MRVCMLNHFSCVKFFVTVWTVACQVPLSMGFSRQGYWSRLPCPLPGDLPDSGIEPAFLMSPALAGGFFTTSATWEAEVKLLVAQSCLTLCDPMVCSPPGSSVHRILKARILEWVAIPFSKGFPWSREGTRISCIAGGVFTVWATREANSKVGLCK